jgi:hypothetical protein
MMQEAPHLPTLRCALTFSPTNHIRIVIIIWAKGLSRVFGVAESLYGPALPRRHPASGRSPMLSSTMSFRNLRITHVSLCLMQGVY